MQSRSERLIDLNLFIIAIPILLCVGCAASAAPLAAAAIRRHYLRPSPTTERRIAIACVILISLSFAGALSDWRLRGYWPQTIGNIAAYLGTCALVAIAFQQKAKRWLRASVAILLTCCFLYGFATKELNEDDQYEESTISRTLKARRSIGGWAGSDWTGVAIVYQPAWMPPVEDVLFKQNISMDKCDYDLIRIRQEPLNHLVIVECGRSNPGMIATIGTP